MISFKLIQVLVLCLAIASTLAELDIISRQEWGAQDPDDDIGNVSLPVSKIIISHTASEACDNRPSCDLKVRNIQKMQMDHSGFSDIAYNFLIGNDGNVYDGRGWNKIGAHTKGHNAASIGIAFIGNFNEEPPSEAALDKAKELLVEGVRRQKISTDFKLFGHRQFSSTNSPGDALYAIIKKWPQWRRRIRPVKKNL